MKYKKILKYIKNLLKDSEAYKVCEEFAHRFTDTAKKISESGPLDEDLAKIIGLLQGLLFLRRKKISKKKKLLYSLIIASLLVLAAVAAVKIYESAEDGDAEEKIRIFLKKLDIESISKSKLIKNIRQKIRESVE